MRQMQSPLIAHTILGHYLILLLIDLRGVRLKLEAEGRKIILLDCLV